MERDSNIATSEKELKLEVIERPGLEEYSATLSFQQQLVDTKAKDRTLSDFLVFVEHHEVYTHGRGTLPQQPLSPKAQQLKWIEISRGGQATYHGPGQLVAYPIFDLETHGRDVHRFLRKLEEVVIETLKAFDVDAFQRDGLTGVWVRVEGGEKKIASIGIGVRKWITYHGLALNVSPDLNYFQEISPCGQEGAVMTSLEELFSEKNLPAPILSEVKEHLVSAFKKVFSFEKKIVEKKIEPPKRPNWLKVRAPGSPQYLETREIIKTHQLVTVCEEARCPNIGECWSHHTATFMIMGELCTRRCSFCSVKDGTVENLRPLDPFEPHRVASAVSKLGLRHVVITSVNRDDLPDMGAEHFYLTAKAIRDRNPHCVIEFLIPDMQGKKVFLEMILKEGLISILNHNLETVPRLYRRVRPGAQFARSLHVLRWVKELSPQVRTKSGLMVGLGEKKDEVLAVMDHLREIDCDILTIGQYLQPTEKQLPVERFITPEEFLAYEEEGKKRGFRFVESGPFVRSSYHAWKHSAPDSAPNVTSVASI